MNDDTKTILVFGAGGMLGTELCEKIAERGWKVEAPTISEVNIADRDNVFHWFEDYSKKGSAVPYAVVNCAAYSNVNGCENLPSEAFMANCIGPKNIADACIRNLVPLFVHVSTDYVFDSPVPERMYHGASTDFFPVNIYGVSKLAGEIAIRSAYHKAFSRYLDTDKILPDYIIARTSRLYGRGRRNYVDFVCDLCLSDVNGMEPPTSPQPIEDGNRTIPTSAKDAATLIVSAIDGFEMDYSNAVINIVDGLGTDMMAPSLYEYTEAIYSILEELGKKPYRWFTKGNRAVDNNSAMRPYNSTLVPPQMLTPYTKTPYWKDSLKEYIKEKYQ